MKISHSVFDNNSSSYGSAIMVRDYSEGQGSAISFKLNNSTLNNSTFNNDTLNKSTLSDNTFNNNTLNNSTLRTTELSATTRMTATKALFFSRAEASEPNRSPI